MAWNVAVDAWSQSRLLLLHAGCCGSNGLSCVNHAQALHCAGNALLGCGFRLLQERTYAAALQRLEDKQVMGVLERCLAEPSERMKPDQVLGHVMLWNAKTRLNKLIEYIQVRPGYTQAAWLGSNDRQRGHCLLSQVSLLPATVCTARQPLAWLSALPAHS
jgi:hypothetical protein